MLNNDLVFNTERPSRRHTFSSFQMAGISEISGSRFWECPQAIDEYCEGRANVLLKYLSTMFKDLVSACSKSEVRSWVFPSRVSIYEFNYTFIA